MTADKSLKAKKPSRADSTMDESAIDDSVILDLESYASDDEISVENEQGAAVIPLPYESEVPGALNTHRTRSYSIASHALNSLRRSSSGQSENSRYALSKQSTRFSVKDIYGDMDENEVRLRRTATRTTILNNLVKRVQTAQENLPRSAGSDEESLQYDKEGTVGVSSSVGISDSEDILAHRRRSSVGLYERMPDTSVPTKDYGREFATIDPELVSWEGPDDVEYPRNWSMREKVFQTFIVAMYTMVSPMTSSAPSPAMPEIAKTLNIVDNPTVQTLCVSIMILAWALGPLIIAPISESDKIGRRFVLNTSVWINLVFNIGCGFCKTPAQMCVFRFLGGLGGCAALNVGAGTLADLFNDNERLVAMAFYGICPTLGPVLSPVMSGFIVQHLNWRWVFHVISIFNGAVAIFGTIFFKETYAPKLLSIKAEKLRKETGNEHLHTIFEIADGETQWEKTVVTISRPLKLLTTNPMVFGLGSFMAFTYGFMYLMIVTLPPVFKSEYGYSTEISGLLFLPMGIGYIFGTIAFTYGVDRVYRHLTEKNGGVSKPEYRLPFLLFSGIGIPIGLIWYGWSVEKKLPWIMPALGTGIFAFAFIAVFIAIQNYLIDMNNRFAASSIAAAAVFRSLFGFSFPLFAGKMYTRLGYGWGNTLCALIGLALGVPFPIFCLKYGERLRNWANKKMEEEQAVRDERNLQRLKKINEEKENRQIQEMNLEHQKSD